MPEPADDVTIRPVRVEDAEAIWRIAREEGVIENILALPSDRLEQRHKQLSELGPDEHFVVAEVSGAVAGLAGLQVGRSRLRHSGHLFVYLSRRSPGARHRHPADRGAARPGGQLAAAPPRGAYRARQERAGQAALRAAWLRRRRPAQAQRHRQGRDRRRVAHRSLSLAARVRMCRCQPAAELFLPRRRPLYEAARASQRVGASGVKWRAGKDIGA
jgi:hypothetical protein